MATRFLLPMAGGGWLGDPLLDFHRDMNRLFENAFRGEAGAGNGGRGAGMAGMSMPQIDVHETDDELCITADLPGVTQGDLDLQIDGDMLTLSGERKKETQGGSQSNYHVMERSHGRFQRMLQLPFAPDPEQVNADFRDGVLTVHLPRRAQQEKRRRIEIKGAGSDGDGSKKSDAGKGAGGDRAGSSGAGSGGDGGKKSDAGKGAGGDRAGSSGAGSGGAGVASAASSRNASATPAGSDGPASSGNGSATAGSDASAMAGSDAAVSRTPTPFNDGGSPASRADRQAPPSSGDMPGDSDQALAPKADSASA